jgi:hypothetical protein
MPLDNRLCMCGHRYLAHEHHRMGLDCSMPECGCLDFRMATWWRKRLAGWKQ